MAAIALDLTELQRSLPKGYRARPFEEGDREPLVAARNREAHPLLQGSAEEWRAWERIESNPEDTRIVVQRDGAPVAMGNVTTGGSSPQRDGAAFVGVGVIPEHRRQGIGGALLELVEAEAVRRGAPRVLAQGNERLQFGVDWALRRGFVEIGRRFEMALDLARFDPARFSDGIARATATGARLVTLAELVADEGEAAYRAAYELSLLCWGEVPIASRGEHEPYQVWRKGVGSPYFAADLSVLALDGPRVASLTLSGTRGSRDGNTHYTATHPAYRGRGLALAIKARAMALAKDRGLRAMLTTNDAPNAAMLAVNRRLGYERLPARIQLEKRLLA